MELPLCEELLIKIPQNYIKDYFKFKSEERPGERERQGYSERESNKEKEEAKILYKGREKRIMAFPLERR